MSGGSRKGAGRKAKPIDLMELEKLCLMHCTDDEIASWFGVSIRTIQSRRRQQRFAETMRRGKARGSINIRRAQLRLLDAGNATIAVWLGRTILGQKDALQLTGANDGPIQPESKADYSKLSVEELQVLRTMLARVSGRSER